MNFLYLCDLFGVAVFACSGALMAGRKSMDLFGVLAIAMVTALGGGTLHDAVLGHHPVSWVKDDTYLYVASIAAMLVVLWARMTKPIPASGLLIADALGLAIATVMGTRVALQMHTSASAAIIMGAITGAAGGVMRDIICNEIPLVFQREIYATASLIGAASFVVLANAGISSTPAALIAMIAVFAVRMSALRWHWALPRFHLLDPLI